MLLFFPSLIVMGFLAAWVGPKLFRASYGSELREIKSADQLATFIQKKATQDVQLEELLHNIQNTRKLKISDYEVEIPVREIYGTIIEERFGNELDKELFPYAKKYDVRAICAFEDSKGDIWRFHITIFEENQYELMVQFLEKRISMRERKK